MKAVSRTEASTRREIITLLRTAGPLTVAELAEKLGITHVAVRRHMSGLEADGLLQSTLVRLPMGRPTKAYTLSEAADTLFPKRYHSLTLEVLDYMDRELGREAVDRFFERRAEQLLGVHAGEVTGDLRERVDRLTEIQAAGGYLATSAEDSNGLWLREHNCPLHQVARKYPEACAWELHFFKEVLGADVERLQCISSGDGCCAYRVKPAE